MGLELRSDRLDSSSTCINLSTRLRVSLGDNSPSSPHLSDERSVGDMEKGSGASNLRG